MSIARSPRRWSSRPERLVYQEGDLTTGTSRRARAPHEADGAAACGLDSPGGAIEARLLK